MSSTPHILANGDLVQDWSNTGSITANDNWAGIASIEGFLGDIDAGSPTAVDPRTLTGSALGAIDVIANQTNPNTATAGGVAEFDGIADPTIALNGSGTADAPGLVVYLDASGRSDVRLQFDARDLDGSADNALQPIAVQYRLGTTGSWTNVPGGYDADVTTGGSATESTAFDLLLPAEVNGRADLQVRVLTTNAAGNDEWVGIDNIHVSSQPLTVSQRVGFATDSLSVSVDEGNSGVTTFTFTVQRDGGTEGNVDFSGSIAATETDSADFPGGVPASFSGTIPDGVDSVTVTVEVAGDMSIEPDEDFALTLTSVSNSAPVPTTIGAGGTATGTIVNDDFPPATKISEIQGSGAASTMVGQTVIVEAIVVGDFQNGDADGGRNLGGFYLQEEILDADGNPLTSEGIFVFGGSADLNVGDRVRVTATVGENFGQTQLNATAVTVIEAGALADVTSMAAVIDLPSLGVTQNQNGQYQPDLEAYEGMLVTIPETLTVTEQFNLDRFNDIKLVAGDRPAQFTHDNAPDVAGYQQHLQEVGSRTITYDDGLNTQNQPIGNLDGYGPDYNTANAPRMGDTVTGLTGVLDYQWAGASASGSTWRVRSIEDEANEFEHVTEREETPADVGGRLQVGSFNVLNYFRTLVGDDTAIGLDPRGANSADEFARQTEKLVNVLAAMDADVLGLIEIENDFLAGSPGNALEYLVDQLNAKLGSDVYDCIYPGSQFLGGDAIAVACIYKPSEVRVALDTTIEVLDDSDLSADFLARSEIGAVFNGVNTSRAVLTVTFEEIDTGYDFTAAINHFKSKSVSADAPPTGENLDQLDGQGAWQDQRELAAEALTSWLATKPTGSDDSDFMLLGDFNAYFMEDTVKLIEDAGYENLQLRLDDPYSYVFDGQTGSLDYIFTSDSMADQVTGVTEWHINADEADALDYNLDFGRDPAIFDADILARVSDHDPILIGLNLTEEAPVAYTLQLLHFSDAEAGLLAPQTAKNLAALVDKFEDEHANTLVLSSGDNFLPGPFIAAGTDPSVREAINAATGSTIAAGVNQPIAAADIAILNAIGIEASTIGNHDFDLGSKVLRDAITSGSVAGWNGANFVYLSANLDFSADADLNPRFTNTVGNGAAVPTQEATTLKGRVAPAAVITEGGERIGIIGATTQLLENISSPTGTEVKGFATDGTEIDDMDLLAAQLQPIIDEMIAEGITKIIVQSHLQQIGNEQLLATKLRGVDIIIGGGSNTRLTDGDDELEAFPGHSPVAEGTYPIVTQGADGKTTLIVNTDGEYTYLGRLTVDFDANGEIVLSSLNPAESGAYVATAEEVAEAWGVSEADLETTAFADGTRGDKVRDITDAVQNVISVKDGNIYGYSDVYLEGERAIIRNQETNLGNLSADANAYALKQALGADADDTYVVSIKNGGGIRAQIGEVVDNPVTGEIEKLPPDGGVSQLDVENSLRFNNKLVAFETTPEGLKAILQNGIALTGNQGRFPQIGGVAFSWDPGTSATTDGLVQDIALIDEDGNVVVGLYDDGVLLSGAPAKITVVTLGFLAQGGDDYMEMKQYGENFRFLLEDGTLGPILPETTDFGVAPVDAMGEQRAFELYMRAEHGTPDTAYDDADTAISGDERIQNLDFRADTVLDGAPIRIGDGETVTGTVTLVDDDHLIIDDEGALVANPAIIWAGGGDAVVDNAGLIEGSGRVLNTTTGATGTLTFNNLEGGTVTGPITPQNAGHADAVITINNAGTIESAANGRAIDFRSFDNSGANAVINNLEGGIIRKIGGDDADVIRPGAGATVNNRGTITTVAGFVDGGDAIDFQGDAGGKVNNYGLIEGSKHAVTGEQAVTVVNEGTMIGRNGSAVNVDNGGSEAEKVFVTNRGTMEGRSAELANSDGDAVDVDGLAQILNYGRIAGLGAEGYHDGEPNVSEGIAMGGGSVLNYGASAEIYGYGRAIQVDNSSNANALGKTFINNEGLIKGDGHGPEGVLPADAALFDLRGNEAVNLVGDYADEFLNQSTGRVVGGVSMGAGNDHLQSLGSFTATGGSAINMGAGNDTMYLYTGTTVSGDILLGTGNDLVLSTADSGFVIDAGEGNDEMYISGYTGGNDVLKGGAGNDRIYSGLGNDKIDGGADNDTLAGEAGNDELTGGAGDDELIGGAGTDTYLYKAGDGSDTIVEETANGITDKLVLDNVDAWDVEFIRSGNDVKIVLDDGEIITLKNQITGGGIEKIVFERGGTFDRGDIIESIDDAPIVGTPVHVATQEDKSASGRIKATDPEHEDLRFSIKNGAGPANGSVSLGRDGRWTYKPAANFFGVDAFVVLVSDGTSTVEALVNVEVTSVNDRPDTTKDFGTAGENETKLFNLVANDTDVEDGAPTLVSFQIKDVDGISLSNSAARAAFTIEGGQLKFNPGSLFDRLDSGDRAEVEISYTVKDANGATSTEEFVLKVNGATDPNVITGSNSSNDINGTSKADLIDARGGNDEIDGRDGNDEIDAGSGNDDVEGGNGNDIIRGGEGNDDLYGEDGNDLISGGAGNDRLWGGDDADTFVFMPGEGRDTVLDFNWRDTIQLDADVFADFGALVSSGALTQGFDGVRIAYNSSTVLTLDDVHISSLHADDFRFV